MTRPAPDVLELARALLRRSSLTPEDAGCQDLLAETLAEHGFRVRRLDRDPVRNLWAVHGAEGATLCFAGHTDVVPPGPLEAWSVPPFAGMVRDGVLYGRGAADMKGGLAAFVAAAVAYAVRQPDHPGRLSLLVTSDEEGAAEGGTRHALEVLRAEGERIDHVLVGEPSSRARVGDTVRTGRRGSLTGRLTILGRSGHVAYAPYRDNPVAHATRVLDALAAIPWPEEPLPFPRTTFQVSRLEAASEASNVTPSEARLTFNLRYGPAAGAADPRRAVEDAIAAACGLPYRLDWREGARAYRSSAGLLREAVRSSCATHTGTAPRETADGGTSDGRFFAEHGAEVVELGLRAEGIHAPDERVSVADLSALSALYGEVLVRFFAALSAPGRSPRRGLPEAPSPAAPVGPFS
jgi:succinyl-diaminopimelate desuccinylase